MSQKLLSAAVKGMIGGGIAVGITILFHSFVLPTQNLAWALVAVSVGSFFSGFFAEYSDKMICETDVGDKRKQYIAIGSVFFILGVTNAMNNRISSALYILAGFLFGTAAYRNSDKDIPEYLDDL
jgi:hypothetical protein